MTDGGGRLRGLVDAVSAVSAGRPLPELLHRTVTAAAELVDAGHGVLAVCGAGGLEQFVAGAAVGPPPGPDLLDRLATERAPIRPYGAAGTAAAFLGGPLRVRDDVFGALYLGEKAGGTGFTAEDGLLVAVLAAAAGVAIDNARLAAERDRRARWSEAFAEIRAALLPGAGGAAALPLIAARARELTGGDAVLLLLPDPAAPQDRLVVVAGDGERAAELRGLRTPVAGSTAGLVYRTGTAMSITDVTGEPAFGDDPRFGPAVLAPLGGPAEVGVLIVARLAGAAVPSPAVVADTAEFAGQAALALRTDEAQRTERELVLLADRERIGRDLHDQVIQRLFATGLELESISRQLESPVLQARLRRSADDLDQTVRDIRRSVFELPEPGAD